MNKQLIFDKVVVHLLTQKRKSQCGSVSDGNMYCAYRGDEGTMCAIGCLIDDENYSSDLEHTTVSDWGIVRAVEKSLELALSYDDIDFMCRLQNLHDNFAVLNWHNSLRDFARMECIEFNYDK